MTLVIKNDGIGDLVLVSGLLAAIAQSRGPLDLVTCEGNREVAENIPGVRRLYLVSRDSIGYQRHLLRMGVRYLRATDADRRVLRQLRETSYTAALCLRRFIRQSSLVVMRHVRAEQKHCAWLFPSNASKAMAADHSRGWCHYQGPETGSELDYFRGFLASTLGLHAEGAPQLRCTDGVELQPDDRTVGLAIAGASTNWPEEHWLGLALALRRSGLRIALFGGMDALPMASKLKRVVPDAENHVGRLSLENAVGVLRQLGLLIANDTGFAHFASLCTSRVLIILGGGTFGRFFPWPGSTRQSIVYKAMPCYDCDWWCQYHDRMCLTGITPENVMKTALEVLRLPCGTTLCRNLASEQVHYECGWRRAPGRGKLIPLLPGESRAGG